MFGGEKKPLTIKKELFLLGFLFLIGVSLLYAGIFIKIMYDSNIEGAKNSLHECNSQMVTYTEGLFHESATIVEILSQADVVIHAGYGDADKVLDVYEPILKSNSNITYLYSGYPDGSLYIGNYETPIGFSAVDRPWYQAAAESDGVTRLVYRDAATDVWLFSQCKKLVDSNGNMTGVVTVDCSNETISRQLSTKYQYATQRSFILDPDGVILIHPDEEEINNNMRDWMDESVWNSIVSGENNYAEYMKNGISAMAYFERIPQTELIAATAIDAQEVTKPIIYSIIFLFLFIIGCSVILGFLLSRILIHRLARPIVELSGRIHNLAAGHPDEARELSFSNAEIKGIAENIEIIVRDIANREEMRKAAEYQSFHDSMTGLYNRRFFEEEMKRLDVKRNYPLGIICCDINGLKLVNDVFGHAVGDKLITTIGACLEKGCRADDILARIGGDEFAVILPSTSEPDVRQVILRMKSCIPNNSIYGAEVSASMGYAVKTQQEQSIDSVMQQADEMMYKQKILGSAEMKSITVQNIIDAAKEEGVVRSLTEEEELILAAFADAVCPEAGELLKDSYRLRKLGLCTLARSQEYNPETLLRRHTEISYHILSAVDNYRSVAGCILHYMEHWDGSGWPVGLSGMDIPLLSRIMTVVDAYFAEGVDVFHHKEREKWYDPSLVKVLKDYVNTR